MSNHQELDRQIADIKTYLSQNKNKLAVNVLSQLKLELLPGTKTVELARLARKAGLPVSGLRSLSHVLTGARPALSEEVTEYCACLNDLGAADESIRRLSERTEKWPVEAAFELGRAYLNAMNLVNSVQLFEESIQRAKENYEWVQNARQLLSRCYRIQGEFAKAIEVLRDTKSFSFDLTLAQNVEKAFGTNREAGMAELKKLKDESVRVRLGELQRELDFYLTNLNQDVSLASKLYFGSPSEFFRDRVRQAWNGELKLPDFFLHGVPATTGATRSFDLFKGVEEGDLGIRLKVGQVLHRLLVALVSDFYGAITITRLHEKVFLGEAFDPKTSPSRIHQIIKRLKQWVTHNRLPIVIEEQSGSYRLRFQEAYFIKISREHLALPQEDPLYVRLELALPRADFSIKEAASALGLSRRFARKILERAENEGWVLMKGRGRTTRYAFHRKGPVGV